MRALLKECCGSPQTGQAALQYGTTAGDATLRRLTASHLHAIDGHPAAARAYAPERMIITNGSQQMLYMMTEALCDPGDIVLVEDPSYFVYLGILQSHGIARAACGWNSDGLDLEHLEKVAGRPEAPRRAAAGKDALSRQLLSESDRAHDELAKKRAALKLLRQFEQHGGASALPAGGRGLPRAAFRADDDVKSALTLTARSERVIYAGTYSKPFATGVRVGFGLMPEPLLTHGAAHQGQPRFRHVEPAATNARAGTGSRATTRTPGKLRRRYARKARRDAAGAGKHFPEEVEWWEPEGGLYFWARLPERRVRRAPHPSCSSAALRANVLYVPGELCYADDPTRRKPGNEMRVSFGGAKLAKDIPEGIARLGRVLRARLGR